MLDRFVEKSERAAGGITLTKEGGLDFTDFAGVQRYARMLVNAGLVPVYKEDNFDKQLARTTASMMLGRRVGLPPEEAVQSIYVVNNRAVLFGDAPLAICRQHKDWVEGGFKEYFEVDGKRIKGNPEPKDFEKDGTRCVVESMRKGASEPMVSTFSVGDAKRAGKMAGLYLAFGYRMLKFRARGYNLRDNFGDALKGLGIRELAADDETPPEESKPALPEGSMDLRKNGKHKPEANGATANGHPAEPPRVVESDAKPDSPTERQPGEEDPAEIERPGDLDEADAQRTAAVQRIEAARQKLGITLQALQMKCWQAAGIERKRNALKLDELTFDEIQRLATAAEAAAK